MITNRKQQKESLGRLASINKKRPTNQRQYSNSNILFMILLGILFNWCVHCVISMIKYTATIPATSENQNYQLQTQHQQQLRQNSAAFVPQQQLRQLRQQQNSAAFVPLHIPMDDTHYNTDSTLTSTKNNNNVLIIATVPRSRRHIIALWSQLECLSGMFGNGRSSYSKIVISTSSDYEPYMAFLVPEIQKQLGQELPPVEVQYHVNDRYDVGLWCDALTKLGYVDGFVEKENVPFQNTIMTNDSFFALRPFDGILEKLRSSDLSLVGLTSSQSRGFWLESFYRGFSSVGIKKFMHYSCKDATHESFGPKLVNKLKKKRKIVQYHEIKLAYQYPEKSRASIFSGDPPSEGWLSPNKETWVQNVDLWKWLVNTYQFPVAKVNMPDMIPDAEHSSLLAQCTQKLSPDFLKSLLFEEEDSKVSDDEIYQEEQQGQHDLEQQPQQPQPHDTKTATTTAIEKKQPPSKRESVSISQLESNALQ